MSPDQEARWEAMCKAVSVVGPLPIEFKIQNRSDVGVHLIAELKTIDVYNPNSGHQMIVRFSFPLGQYEYEPTRALLVRYAIKVYTHECFEQLRDSRERSEQEQMFAHENVHPYGTSPNGMPDWFNL